MATPRDPAPAGRARPGGAGAARAARCARPAARARALGLGVVSLVALAAVSHGQMVRQAAFLGVGARRDARPLARRLLAPARAEVGHLRDPDRLDPRWSSAVGHAIAGTASTRSIAISAFSFQASEFGKVLLIVFLAAFVVDRSRRPPAATSWRA